MICRYTWKTTFSENKIWPDWWHFQSSSLVREYPQCFFKLQTNSGSWKNSRNGFFHCETGQVLLANIFGFQTGGFQSRRKFFWKVKISRKNSNLFQRFLFRGVWSVPHLVILLCGKGWRIQWSERQEFFQFFVKSLLFKLRLVLKKYQQTNQHFNESFT